jgi:hypothetical protein
MTDWSSGFADFTFLTHSTVKDVMWVMSVISLHPFEELHWHLPHTLIKSVTHVSCFHGNEDSHCGLLALDHRVVCQVVTNILEKWTVSIFRVKVKMVAETFSQILVTTYQLTSCYNSEHINMGITTCHTIYYTCSCSFTLATYIVWSNNIRIVIFFCDNSIYLLAHNVQSFLANSCGKSRCCIILGSMCVEVLCS